MKNLILASLLIISTFIFSNSVFSQTTTIEIPEYSGCGDGGCRIIGMIPSMETNWTNLEGKIQGGFYAGYNVSLVVKEDVASEVWNSLNHQVVPGREVKGELVIKNESGGEFLMSGTFTIIQGYGVYKDKHRKNAILIQYSL